MNLEQQLAAEQREIWEERLTRAEQLALHNPEAAFLVARHVFEEIGATALSAWSEQRAIGDSDHQAETLWLLMRHLVAFRCIAAGSHIASIAAPHSETERERIGAVAAHLKRDLLRLMDAPASREPLPRRLVEENPVAQADILTLLKEGRDAIGGLSGDFGPDAVEIASRLYQHAAPEQYGY